MTEYRPGARTWRASAQVNTQDLGSPTVTQLKLHCVNGVCDCVCVCVRLSSPPQIELLRPVTWRVISAQQFLFKFFVVKSRNKEKKAPY